MTKASWRDEFTVEKAYPEGLRGLIELVHRFVPRKSWGDGPYGPFVALIESNLADWEATRQSRGHLVGMGMGSIHDLGGPGSRASLAEREQFERFDDALRWMHDLTWTCAEQWLTHGKRWTPQQDRAVLTKLEVQQQVVVWTRVCLRCKWQGAVRSDMKAAVNTLEKTSYLRQLVTRGGKAVARALLRPRTAKQMARREKLCDALAATLPDQGVRVYAKRYPTRCPACQGRLVGNYVTPDAATVRELIRV